MKTLTTFLTSILLSAAVFASDLAIVVPTSPAGPTDLIGRALVTPLSRNRSVIVLNKSGAAGLIGASYAASAVPDGNTILVASHGIVLLPLLSKTESVQYTHDSLIPVASLATMPTALVVSTSFPASNYDEFVQEIKKNPLKHSLGVTNIRGTAQAVEVFKATGVEPNIVNYKGESQQIGDIVGNNLTIAIVTAATAKKYLDSKHMKVIAMFDTQRWADIPTVPAIVESYPTVNKNVIGPAWWGVFVPIGTPVAVMQTLNTEINQALSDPSVVRILKDLSCSPAPMSLSQVTEFHKKQIAVYKILAAQ